MLLPFVSCVTDKFPSVPVDFVYVNATDSEVLMNAYSYMYDLEQTYSIDPGSSLILTEESYGGLVDGYPSGYDIPFADSGFSGRFAIYEKNLCRFSFSSFFISGKSSPPSRSHSLKIFLNLSSS